ncbi:hypothetical protein HK100_007475 [Physocladia obscura]|uniref:Rap-GAP domain-containing protein n=1 Tax=Physocladia obscura TaxID=109957 RepID=A0AAD5SQP2_9FUNG|nr:hypothetical protein HK100_007475 [Physocladia obscura]
MGPKVENLMSAFSSGIPARALALVKSPGLPNELLAMEERQVIRSYKFGVGYCKARQVTEADMMSNRHVLKVNDLMADDASPAFKSFLSFLGETIELRGWKGYRAGLDVSGTNQTGTHAIYTKWQGYEVMFHVSTLLPYNEKDKQQLERKRHLGNDIVVIIFQDTDDQFQLSSISSHQNHILAFVKPEGDGFKFICAVKQGVPIFIPEIPDPPIFGKDAVSRDFFLHILVNGERASYKSPSFAPKISRTRSLSKSKMANPRIQEHRTRYQVPMRTEYILIACVLLLCALGIWSEWINDGTKSEILLHQRQNTSSIPLPPFYFQDRVKLRHLLENAVHKVINEGSHEENGVSRKAAAILQSSHDAECSLISPNELESIIDLYQAQFLDYLNGEEGMAEENLFGGSLNNLSQPFNLKATWCKIHQYALYIKSRSYNRTHFHELGRRVRSNLIAYTILHNKPSLTPFLIPEYSTGNRLPATYNSVQKLQSELSSVILDISRLLYPWLKPTYSSIHDMQTSFLHTPHQEGIALCSGKWHFEMAVHAITTLRTVLNCTLPIEVFYGGDDDLTPYMISAFNAIPDVKTVNLLEFFPEETRLWGGWSMKPYAMLASKFRRVIILDADTLFFEDPRVILKSSGFVKYGQVFYHDRTLGGNDPWWFKSINPIWSKYSSGLRYMKKDLGSSQHEMESGVVAIDKARTGVLHAMLLAAKMNSKFERDEITYHRVYGDKETYWISFDIARVPYVFSPAFGGTVGYKNEKGNICGGLFHTDERLKPLWWNGGVVANKHGSRDNEFIKFEFAAFDTHAVGIEWEWETKVSPFCLGPNEPDKEILVLSDTNRAKGEKYVQIYKEIKENGWKNYFDTIF